MLSDAVHFCVFVHRGKKASVFNYDPLTKNILIIKANTSNCVCEFGSNTVYMVKKNTDWAFCMCGHGNRVTFTLLRYGPAFTTFVTSTGWKFS